MRLSRKNRSDDESAHLLLRTEALETRYELLYRRVERLEAMVKPPRSPTVLDGDEP